MNDFITLDLAALLSLVFVGLSCTLVGNYLLLKKESLLGDSISHSVLPGIVMAFMLTGSRSIYPVFLGALAAGILSSILIWLVIRFGRTEPSAAMGIIFSIFFALGVVLIENKALRSVDLDPDCLLHGQVETIFWLPSSGEEVSILNFIYNAPSELYQSVVILFSVSILILAFWKEFKLVSFDRSFCFSQGFSPLILELILLVLISLTVVISFKIVGSILVVALLIAPAASARLLTNSLKKQFLYSSFIGVLCIVSGYLIATRANQIFDNPAAINVAGVISATLGVIFIVITLFSPPFGILPRYLKQVLLRIKTLKEDILGELYRLEEAGEVCKNLENFREGVYSPAIKFIARKSLVHSKLIVDTGDYVLSDLGREKARHLVRKHRLWEVYLSNKLGVDEAHVHGTAEVLEHVKSPLIEKELTKLSKETSVDPHGKPIP